MKLLIVESPSKAKTISKYLGKGFKVTASVGHVRDLPKNSKRAVDVESDFKPHYEIVKGKEKIVAEIRASAKKADEVILATDPDREGEAIAWHIAELIKDIVKSKPKRAVYHEITKDAVEKALSKLRGIDHNLRKAQEARRVLDRLVGYDLSGLIWKKVRYGLSAGRVQSPALRILVEREREIKDFKSEKYFVIRAETNTQKGDNIIFVCSEEPKEKPEADKILEIGKAGKWAVTNIEESETKRSPRPPFTTSTLQQVASSRLGFSPARTMIIAQRLYEAGLITYMRTDSATLSETAIKQIGGVIENNFGANLSVRRVFRATSKNAQEAHEAIRPTNVSVGNAGINQDQRKLYRLIWQRTVASQMADAKIVRTKITSNIENGAIPDFTANGSRTIFPGWLLADPAARGEDIELPKTVTGDKLKLIDITADEKQTEPPPRYTEAGLVKELEKRGIGRPSTYASIIKTLEDRGYTEKLGRSLKPTDTGEVVSTFLENNFGKYISDNFTAEMENELDEIAAGKREYAKTLKEFYSPFSKDVKSNNKNTDKITNLGDAPINMKCPICGGSMIVKLSRSGKFYSCKKFPECNGARTIEGKELEGPKETGEMCPECKEGKLVERDGRFGRFVACSRYPKCRYIKRDENGTVNSSDVKCPQCKEGEMVEKRGKFGIFWSCSNYPRCKNAIKAKPTGNICPQCQSLMMEGTKTIPERCSNKICPNHNPHKQVKKPITTD